MISQSSSLLLLLLMMMMMMPHPGPPALPCSTRLGQACLPCCILWSCTVDSSACKQATGKQTSYLTTCMVSLLNLLCRSLYANLQSCLPYLGTLLSTILTFGLPSLLCLLASSFVCTSFVYMIIITGYTQRLMPYMSLSCKSKVKGYWDVPHLPTFKGVV